MKPDQYFSRLKNICLATLPANMFGTAIMGLLVSLPVFPPGAAGLDLQSPFVDIVANSSLQTGSAPCDALISAGFSERILLPTESLYSQRIQSYWSLSAQLQPWCIFYPHTASEIFTALVALSTAGDGAVDWHIAVRGGGPSTWAGINSVSNGVNIDLGYFSTS